MNTNNKIFGAKYGIIMFLFIVSLIRVILEFVNFSNWFYIIGVGYLAILIVVLMTSKVVKLKLETYVTFKSVNIKSMLSTLMIWIGTFILMICVEQFVGYFLPSKYFEIQTNNIEIYNNFNIFFVLIVSVLFIPFVEEVLFRGFIQKSLYVINSDWIVVAIVGAMFAIFKFNLVEILPNFILGVSLSYVMIKTNNLLLPLIMNCMYNAVKTLSLISANKDDIKIISEIVPIGNLAIFLIISSFAVFVLFWGSALLQSKNIFKNKLSVNIKLIALVLFLLVSGLVIKGQIDSRPPALVHNETYSVNDETTPLEIQFKVAQNDVYYLNMDVSNERGLIDFRIFKDQSDEVMNLGFRDIETTTRLLLSKGDYRIVVNYRIADALEWAEENGYALSDNDVEILSLDGDLSEFQNVTFEIERE